MVELLQVVSFLLVAVAMALSLAHALEFPGKLRLSEKQYLAIQQIYYPGFTIGGAAEPLGVLFLLALLFFTSTGISFWLTTAAAITLAAAHAAYWLMTHPVNNFWLKGTKLSTAGSSFFDADPLARRSKEPSDWQTLRNRWEWSHVVRALLSFASLTLLATAMVLT